MAEIIFKVGDFVLNTYSGQVLQVSEWDQKPFKASTVTLINEYGGIKKVSTNIFEAHYERLDSEKGKKAFKKISFLKDFKEYYLNEL